jgi:hypothetical protein
MTQPVAPPVDLAELRRLAEAIIVERGPEWEGPDWYEAADFFPDQMDWGEAQFIAAANPDTILRLLDEHGRLRSFTEKVAESETNTAGTRSAAQYALTGSLVGAVHEMRRAALQAERPTE